MLCRSISAKNYIQKNLWISDRHSINMCWNFQLYWELCLCCSTHSSKVNHKAYIHLQLEANNHLCRYEKCSGVFNILRMSGMLANRLPDQNRVNKSLLHRPPQILNLLLSSTVRHRNSIWPLQVYQTFWSAFCNTMIGQVTLRGNWWRLFL